MSNWTENVRREWYAGWLIRCNYLSSLVVDQSTKFGFSTVDVFSTVFEVENWALCFNNSRCSRDVVKSNRDKCNWSYQFDVWGRASFYPSPRKAPPCAGALALISWSVQIFVFSVSFDVSPSRDFWFKHFWRMATTGASTSKSQKHLDVPNLIIVQPWDAKS